MMRSHPKVAIFYTLGAMTFVLVVPISHAWFMVPLWLASLMAVFAVAYWLGVENPYHKKIGRIRWTVRLSAAPHMIGTSLVRRWKLRRMRSACDEIIPGLWLGRLLNQREAAQLVEQRKLIAVLDLTAEHGEPRGLRQLIYLNLPVLDMTAPSCSQLEQGAMFIADQIKRGPVYVHCGQGQARSAAVVAGYLLFSGQSDGVQQACEQVTLKRPEVKWKPYLLEPLREFEDRLTQARRRRDQSPQSQPPGGA